MLVQIKVFNEILEKMIHCEDGTMSTQYILDLVDEINDMTIKLLILNQRAMKKKIEKGETNV